MAEEGTALQERPTGGRAKTLIIVARDWPDLCYAMTQQFGGHEGIVILLDRRHGERRHSVQPYSPDRRRADRRSVPKLEEDLRSRQYVIVRRSGEEAKADRQGRLASASSGECKAGPVAGSGVV